MTNTNTIRIRMMNEFLTNVLSGFTMAMIGLIIAVGFSYLAGVPPEMMVVATIVAIIIGHFVNSTEAAVGGANSATAILTTSAVVPFAPQMSDIYISYVITLTFFVGIWLLLFSLIFSRYDLADYVNDEISDGLVLGIGALIVLSSFYMILGLPPLLHDQWIIFDMFSLTMSVLHGEGSYFALMVGMITLAAGLITKSTAYRQYSILVALFCGILATFLFESLYSVTFYKIGAINLDVILTRPDFSESNFPFPVANLIMPAFAIAIINIIQIITIAKSLKNKHGIIDISKDIYSQSLQHLVMSFFNGTPAANSLNKSYAKVQLKQGPRTELYSLIFIILLVVFFGSFLMYISLPTMGAILMLSGFSMIRLSVVIGYLKNAKIRTWILFGLTAILVVVQGLFFAVFFAVISSVFFSVLTVAKITFTHSKENKILTLKLHGTLFSHSWEKIPRYIHENNTLLDDVDEIIFDITNAVLDASDVVDFNWMDKIRDKYRITIKSRKDFESEFIKFKQLNPTITGFNYIQV